MTEHEINARLTALYAKCGYVPDASGDLKDLDSLALITFLDHVEKEFQIRFSLVDIDPRYLGQRAYLTKTVQKYV